jgi:hypothetical protein
MTDPATNNPSPRPRGSHTGHYRSAGHEPASRLDDVAPADGVTDEVLRLYDEHHLGYEGIARALGISAGQAERIIDTVYRQRADELARPRG